MASILSQCVNNNSALVHMMAWYQTGDKPLSEPMMTFKLADAYISLRPSDAIMRH